MAEPSVPPARPLLDAALDYAARGVPVFPLRPRDKVPLTEHGLLDASVDEAQIRQWWRRWPQANVGVPTGPASGWLVVDLDTRHGATYDTLAALGPKLPPTMTAQTGSGGLHLVWRYPRDGTEIRNSAGRMAQGVDVRGDGGYIVVAPSRHPSGGMYEWANDLEPAPCPSWLLKLILAEPTPIRKLASAPARPRAMTGNADDRDAYWLAWALERSGAGTGDQMGYQLAQQLYTDPGVRDIDGTLADYAQRATLDVGDPFDDRDVDRWLKSAQHSRIVMRGEPAKGQRAKTAKTAKTAKKSPPAGEGDHPPSPPLHAVPPSGTEPPDLGDLALLAGEADDNGNAECMFRLFGREYLFTPSFGWLRWTGTHWHDVPEPEVTQSTIVTLKRRRHAAVEHEEEAIVKTTKADRNRVQGCRELFKSYVLEPSVAVFDADPDAINCQNGVLHLRTGTLTPHDAQTQRFTYCLPVEYDATADFSHWAAFVLDCLGRDQAAADYLQLCAGYSLTGHTRDEKLFYVHGPSRAGKGTMTETLIQLLPKPLSSEVDFATFTARRENDSQNFDLAELRPARLVIASESTRNQALNPAKIKALTGGNYVRCAFKHKDMFSYRPQFKVWLVSNWPLQADADDEAAWGRVQVFTFPHSHLGSEDTTLKARMKSRESLRGVLAWAVAGAMRWYADGRLTPPESVSAATKAHRDAQDYMQQWIDDRCILNAERWATSASLMASYQAWCKANNVTPHNQTDFAETLIRRFGCASKRGHGGVRGYKGVSLQPLDDG